MSTSEIQNELYMTLSAWHFLKRVANLLSALSAQCSREMHSICWQRTVMAKYML